MLTVATLLNHAKMHACNPSQLHSVVWYIIMDSALVCMMTVVYQLIRPPRECPLVITLSELDIFRILIQVLVENATNTSPILSLAVYKELGRSVVFLLESVFSIYIYGSGVHGLRVA